MKPWKWAETAQQPEWNSSAFWNPQNRLLRSRSFGFCCWDLNKAGGWPDLVNNTLGEKEFEMYWLKLSNLVLLLGATAWLVKTPDWEPMLAFIGFLTTFLVQDIKEFKNSYLTKGVLNKDKENFEKYNAILSDSELLDELNNGIFNLRTDMGFVKRLGQFLRRAEQIEGEFNEKHIQKIFSEAVEDLKKLKGFLAKHFFVPNEGVTETTEGEFLLYLYPDLKYSNDPEKRQIYKERERELQALIDQVINSYECYRKLIKKKMHI